MNQNERERKKKLLHSVSAGIFLVGLAILFYLNALWPWILVLVGVFMVLEALLRYYFQV